MGIHELLRKRRNYRNLRNAVLNLTGYEDYDSYDIDEAFMNTLNKNLLFNLIN